MCFRLSLTPRHWAAPLQHEKLKVAIRYSCGAALLTEGEHTQTLLLRYMDPVLTTTATYLTNPRSRFLVRPVSEEILILCFCPEPLLFPSLLPPTPLLCTPTHPLSLAAPSPWTLSTTPREVLQQPLSSSHCLQLPIAFYCDSRKSFSFLFLLAMKESIYPTH